MSHWFTTRIHAIRFIPNRSLYRNISDANAVKATTETRVIGGKTMTYQPKWFADATVVTE